MSTYVTIQLGYKPQVWFDANPTFLLESGQIVYLEQTGKYKLGDGITELQNLIWLGTQDLSNLVPYVGANANIIPQDNGVQEFGAVGNVWANGFFADIKFDSGVNIDVQNRMLRNSNGNRTIEYEESRINDKDGVISIDAHNRILKSTSGSDALDYSNNANISVTSDLTAPGTIHCDSIKPNSVQLQGTGGGGFIEFQNQSSPAGAPVLGWRQYVSSVGAISFKNASNLTLSLNTSAMTGNVDLSVGNTTGTIAVTAYVDAKVQNSLAASTTIAPSATAVNTAINGKQATLSGTGIVKSTAGTISYVNGTSSQFIKGDGSLDSSTYLTSATAGSTYMPLTGGTFTGSIAATNLSGTNTGDETNATIKTKLGAATTSLDGYLTSTDWNTFNGKLTSVTGTTNRVTITGGSTIDIASTYVGQSSITTLGTITTGVWNGTSIANANLANSSMTINGTAISLGSSGTITAEAGTLTGTTLNATVVSSSLTSVGTIATGTWQGTSISTTYTDAKIKGSVTATSGLIPCGTGIADTVTSFSAFYYDTTTFAAGPSTSIQLKIGTTSTNAMIRLDSVGLRVGPLSSIASANTYTFQAGTKFLYGDSASLLQLGTPSTGQFQLQTSFFGSGSGVLSTIGSFMGGNGTRGSMAFAPSADLANVGDKVLFAYHTGSAWASAIEYANASAANVVVSIVSAGGQMKVGGSSFFGGSTTPTAFAHIAASTTARASLRIVNGTAPTSPNDGDIWYDGTDLKMRVGGTTKTFTLI
jgi:hypothetical protein